MLWKIFGSIVLLLAGGWVCYGLFWICYVLFYISRNETNDSSLVPKDVYLLGVTAVVLLWSSICLFTLVFNIWGNGRIQHEVLWSIFSNIFVLALVVTSGIHTLWNVFRERPARFSDVVVIATVVASYILTVVFPVHSLLTAGR